MLKVIVLGCGSSLGVPIIGCKCKICKSDLIHNKRSRCAIIIKDDKNQILVDFGFDIKSQLLRANIDKLDAAILTHDHADHISGINELRIFANIEQKSLKIITDHSTGTHIENIYKYLFNNYLVGDFIDFYATKEFGNLKLQFFKQFHGAIYSLGIRINNFAYTIDVNEFPVKSEQFLYNLDYWIIDCQDYNSNSRHMGLDKILTLNEKFRPGKMFLSNLSHKIDYEAISKILPNNIVALYDGYIINI